MDNYNLSIVMPVYNSSAFLQKTIEAFLKQTYSNWELILVDDFSGDNSFQIAQESAKSDSRIKPYRLEKNQGVAFARHFGNLKAQGEIIVVADSDDEPYTERLEVINNLFSQKPHLDVVYSNLMVYDQETGKIEKRFFQPFDQKLLYQVNYIPNPSSAYKKATYQKTQGYDPLLRIGEDYDLWLKFVEIQATFYGLDQPLVKYTRRDSALTSAQKGISERQKWIRMVRERHHITSVDPEYVKDHAVPGVTDFFLNDPYYSKIWFGASSLPETRH